MRVSAFWGETFIKISLSKEIHIKILKSSILSMNAAINSDNSIGLEKSFCQYKDCSNSIFFEKNFSKKLLISPLVLLNKKIFANIIKIDKPPIIYYVNII